MTARVDRSWLRLAGGGKGAVMVETRRSSARNSGAATDPVAAANAAFKTAPPGSVARVGKKSRDPKSVVWNEAHLDVPRRGRFPVSEKSARTTAGIVFDSKGEAARYTQLKLLERAGLVSDVQVQPSWDVMIEGQKFCTYTADFSYLCKERGRPVIEDVKSSGTQKDAAYRLRKRAAELAFGIKIDEVLV